MRLLPFMMECYVSIYCSNYHAPAIEERRKSWELALNNVTAYCSQDNELSIRLYPNLPQTDPNQYAGKTT